jgi:hypothetical protein
MRGSCIYCTPRSSLSVIVRVFGVVGSHLPAYLETEAEIQEPLPYAMVGFLVVGF